MIVIDASVWVRALVDAGAQGDAARTVMTADPGWVAPAHAAVEVLRTLRRYETAGALTATQADGHVASLLDAEVRYVGAETWLLAAVWKLRHNVSPYDAPYVAIASALDAPLVTFDGRLATAAKALGVDVIVPGEN